MKGADTRRLFYRRSYDNDFPHMIIYSLPAPFYVDGTLDHEKVKQTTRCIAGVLTATHETVDDGGGIVSISELVL